MAATAFDDDRSSRNEMATVFEIQHGSDRLLELLQLCISDVIDKFQFEVTMFALILVTIGRIVKKWQQFFEIQDFHDFQEKYISG